MDCSGRAAGDGNELVICERSGATAIITLNRPESLNAWTPDLGRQLLAALRQVGEDPEVRAVLITGAGRAFSAGADVKNRREMTPEGVPDLSIRLREIYNPIALAIRAAPKPVIAAVNGVAAGLGCSLALACDLVVAAESAYFLLAFVHIGVMPDAGAARFLAERVGRVRAAELTMLGERLPSRRAQEWGLVNAVHPDEDLLGAGRELAERLAGGPTLALANIKRTLVRVADEGLADYLDFEAGLQQSHATSADYAEGVRAFAERRPPSFRGA